MKVFMAGRESRGDGARHEARRRGGAPGGLSTCGGLKEVHPERIFALQRRVRAYAAHLFPGRQIMSRLALTLAAALLAVPVFAQSGPPRELPRDPEHPPLRLAILLFEGVQVIDFTGPYEVFSQASWPGGMMFEVCTVAETRAPLLTSPPWGGLQLTPEHDFASCPEVDVLVLPGGRVDPQLQKPAVMDFIRARAAQADVALSVCNGAFFLARAGLLDGQRATTYHGMIDQLAEAAPAATVVWDERFVDNGRIITTAGLSSGIDGALHLVERIGGHELAENVARGMEYDWRPQDGYARAALADRHLRRMLGRNGFPLDEDVSEWATLAQDGDREHWQKDWSFASALERDAIMDIVDGKIAESWTKAEAARTDDVATSRWAFHDEAGAAWSATARLWADGSKLRLTLKLERQTADADGKP
jgi:putative intracellular protease/amidase